MPYLSWISDDAISGCVKYLLNKAQEAEVKAQGQFGKNVIDPFASTFEIAGFGMSFEDWMTAETRRQAQKTLQNHVGEFHQKVLGSVDGWEDLGRGNEVDLLSSKKEIIAEVKNKYNTISGGKLADLYYALDKLVMPNTSRYKGHTAYYVTIIPKKKERFDKPFTPSDKSRSTRCASNVQIREIDGASFYALVTGKTNAMKELFDVLPQVVKDCSHG